jgi:hypothetical protein
MIGGGHLKEEDTPISSGDRESLEGNRDKTTSKTNNLT